MKKTKAPATVADADANEGPKMRALPTDRHRAFVRALFVVKPGHGMNVKAARLAGFGTPTSSPQSMASIACRVAQDERVIEAIREYGERVIGATAAPAINALNRLIANPAHRDHGRAVGMVLSRVFPEQQTIKVQHDATAALLSTAEVLARIAVLAERAGLKKLPPLIDLKPAEVSTDADS